MYNLANISNYFPINSISVLTYIKKKENRFIRNSLAVSAVPEVTVV